MRLHLTSSSILKDMMQDHILGTRARFLEPWFWRRLLKSLKLFEKAKKCIYKEHLRSQRKDLKVQRRIKVSV